MRMVSHARVLTAAALAALGGCATAPSSPQSPGVEVDVYQAPLDGPNAMPSGCNELWRTAPQSWTELDRTAPTDPYRTQRAATATDGGNVLLVLDRVAYPRNDYDCPAAARITDCPPSLGAWFDVVFVSYACSAPGLSKLPRERRP